MHVEESLEKQVKEGNLALENTHELVNEKTSTLIDCQAQVVLIPPCPLHSSALT